MQYAMATNWDPELPAKIAGTAVTSLYGQIWNDPLGGGRMALFLPRIGKKEAEAHMAEARRHGIGFSYLANATCFDNTEFTRRGYRTIVEHLEWIAAAGAEMITVSLPFLVELVKTRTPQLKVCVSSFARIATVHQARYWVDLGADKLILPEAANRDFVLLHSIREAVDCELELIANHSCLYHCPLDLHHRNMVSHGSQQDHACGGFAVDHCKLSCQRIKLMDPAELIRSRWIRPEDVGAYEELQIDCLKLVERFRETESLVRILGAYERRQSPENLAELLTLPQAGEYRTPNMECLDRPDLVAPERMKEIVAVLREPFTDSLRIETAKLDGFLDYYREHDCLHSDCHRCGYCARVAKKAVVVDETWRKEMVARFDRVLALLSSGAIAGKRK